MLKKDTHEPYLPSPSDYCRTARLTLRKGLRRDLHVLIILTAEGAMLDRISEAIWAIVT
jgi:hypothetical protein